jgi:hypothetical protein
LKEISHVKRIFRYLPLLLLPAFSVPLAHAQYGFDIGIGFGAMQDKASANGIEGDETLTNFLGPCTPNNSADPLCLASSSLSGVAMGVSGNVMAWKHFGIGADVAFQPGKQTYVAFPAVALTGQTALTLQSRMTLFDFNGIYQPVRTKKVAFQVIGGVGGANLRFYEAGQTGSNIGPSNFSQFFGSNNHFQVHGGVAVQFYVTDHVFIRPQFDIHYVPNLTQQFGSNLVTAETVWVGYTFGSQ